MERQAIESQLAVDGLPFVMNFGFLSTNKRALTSFSAFPSQLFSFPLGRGGRRLHGIGN